MAASDSDKLESIQMLRAVAAVAVVTHHAPFLGDNGQWGVDLFFVISGFIICYVTERSADRFFLKRIIRVVPLYWAGTLGIFAVAFVAPALLNSEKSAIALVRSLAFVPSQQWPLLFLGWSLNYEMYFYVLFAIAMRVSHRHRAAICSVIIAAVVAYGRLAHPSMEALQFWSANITLEFPLGMLAFYAYRATKPNAQSATTLPRAGWFVAGAVALACLPLASALHWERIFRYGILAAICFYCVVRALAGVRLPKWIVLLGDASYSLYLFHPYIIQTLIKVLRVFTAPSLVGYLAAIASVIVCCVFAVVCYRFVEKPTTEFLRKRLLPRGG